MQNQTTVDAASMHGFVHRPMSPRMQKRLREQFCKRHASVLWTKKRFIIPEVLPFVWGNGKLIVAVRPIITRKEHFIVAVDSSWQNDMHDLIDDIYDVHEDYFGPCRCVECGGDEEEHEDGDIRFKQWPVICTNGGCEWWFLVR
jgi:hypothetical protein